jgi:hypothetical protein
MYSLDNQCPPTAFAQTACGRILVPVAGFYTRSAGPQTEICVELQALCKVQCHAAKKANSAKTSHPRAQAPFAGNKSRREGILKHIQSDYSAFSEDFNFKLTIGMHDFPKTPIRSCGMQP